jgi:hypothetical protein
MVHVNAPKHVTPENPATVASSSSCASGGGVAYAARQGPPSRPTPPALNFGALFQRSPPREIPRRCWERRATLDFVNGRDSWLASRRLTQDTSLGTDHAHLALALYLDPRNLTAWEELAHGFDDLRPALSAWLLYNATKIGGMVSGNAGVATDSTAATESHEDCQPHVRGHRTHC